MSKGRLVVTVLSSATLAGCLTLPGLAESPEQTLSRAAESESAKTNRVIFVCPQGALLTVEFVTSDPTRPAIVRAPDGGQLSLAAQASGSGYRYADGTHELRGKGREVTWTDASKPPVACTEQTPPAGGTESK
ncbi:MAG: MliC family protein [Parafilimonas terrae]|nr:MliC family protein [Parafilimonas terrae]